MLSNLTGGSKIDLAKIVSLFQEGLNLAQTLDRRHTVAQCSFGLGLALLRLGGEKRGHGYLVAGQDLFGRLGRKSRLSRFAEELR